MCWTAGFSFRDGMTTAYRDSWISGSSRMVTTRYVASTTLQTLVGTAKIPAPACPNDFKRALSPNSPTIFGLNRNSANANVWAFGPYRLAADETTVVKCNTRRALRAPSQSAQNN